MRFAVIKRDNYPCNPREWDNLGTMVCWHRRYNLGDPHNYHSPEYFFEDLLEQVVDLNNEEFWEFADALDENIRERILAAHYLILPVYMYEHSGIALSTRPFSCRWDSGQVGYIYVSYEDIAREYGEVNDETIARARRVLEAEVEEYSSYLAGNVYCVLVYEYYPEDDFYELIDSVGGFIGDSMADTGMAEYLPEFKLDRVSYIYDNMVITDDGEVFDSIDECLDYLRGLVRGGAV